MAEAEKKVEPISFYYESGFDCPDDLPIILGAVPDEAALSPAGVGGVYGALLQYPPLSADQERHLFRKFNCLKYLAFMADHPDERDDCLIDAGRVKNRIVEHTLRLVWAMSKKGAGGGVSPTGLSDGVLCLLRCVDQFDYRPPGPFAAYLCTALRRSRIDAHRHSEAEERHLGRPCHCRLDLMPATEERNSEEEWDEVARRIEAGLPDPRDRTLMLRRLGLFDGRAWLFNELAHEFGCSAEAVRKRFHTCSVRVFGRPIDSNLLDFLTKL